jgi:hypothetical protein
MTISKETRVIILGLCITLSLYAALHLSFEQPYVPNAPTRLFFWIVVPFFLFLLLGRYTLFRKIGRYWLIYKVYRGKLHPIPRGFLGVLTVLMVCFGFPLMMGLALRTYLAYPTKWFAKSDVALQAVVKSNRDNASGSPDYSNLALHTADEDIAVLWPTVNARQLSIGACVQLKTRAWPLGSYIDAISLTDCAGRQAKADAAKGVGGS